MPQASMLWCYWVWQQEWYPACKKSRGLLKAFKSQTLIQQDLESLTWHEMSSTVCLNLCSDGSSIRYSIMTLNFELLTPKFNAFISVLSHVIGVRLVKTNTLQDIVLTSPESAVSSIHETAAQQRLLYRLQSDNQNRPFITGNVMWYRDVDDEFHRTQYHSNKLHNTQTSSDDTHNEHTHHLVWLI